ncbi:vacuolar-type H+-ATPase subunit I/STV1 [Lactobacillus colini]|uniref:Vacuolar-type H+-ATPase subunit I/STV1 n=1 Tax=Lactobacillus colini TaxID=1819254 RepID=A0ABS4MBF0_9LACO|nr:DUF4355 domain-containing protein [Lactobacillus colini]MBP2057006.1 vacuolar-type H+-ATPase subunit I/STV1 [Lactobacillus colini]
MDDNKTVDQVKTFTQEELDQVVKERVARERAKYSDYDDLKTKAGKFDEIEEANKSELEKLTETNQKLQSQIDNFNKANTLREAQDKVAAETGLPLSVVKTLSGKNVDELTQSAKTILDFNKNQGSSYPRVKNSSSSKSRPVSKENEFLDWLNSNLK